MIFFWGLLIFLVILLGYLSLSDIKLHEIPMIPAVIGIIVVLTLVILNSLLPEFASTQLPELKDALLGFAIAAGLTALLVVLTKEKAVGKGDILLFGIMGLALGLSNLLVGFMICVYSATIYGIILGVIKKKFHGLEVPMVPFISLGIISGLLFHSEIFTFTNHLITLIGRLYS